MICAAISGAGIEARATLRGRRILAAAPVSHGFTLIEMLVLIIIIAVMSSLAVPSYSRFHASMQFKQSVRSVVGMLQFARDSAIQYNSDATVRYDSQSGAFVVTVEPPDVGQDQPTALQDTTDAAAAQQPPPPTVTTLGEDVGVAGFQVLTDPSSTQTGVNATDGQSIRFHDDGTADGAQILLRSAHGYQSEIDVWPTTGRATVAEEESLNGGR